MTSRNVLLILLLGVASICSLLTVSASAQEQLGKLILHKQVAGPWTLLDAHDTTVFFVRENENSELKVTCTLPELRCFLVNHLKDQLRVRYGVYQREVDGRAQRTNLATEVISLTNEDNLKDWATKEAADSTLMAQHHAQLAEYLKNPEAARK